MRELTEDEIKLVSGGEDPLVLPPVTVVGQRPNRNPWLIQQQLDALSPPPMPAQTDRDRAFGGEGHGQGWQIDPDPDNDGFDWLKVEYNADGTLTYTAEVKGYFDYLNPNGSRDDGEKILNPGQGGTTLNVNDWGDGRDAAFAVLSSFTPLPPEAGV